MTAFVIVCLVLLFFLASAFEKPKPPAPHKGPPVAPDRFAEQRMIARSRQHLDL